MLLPAGADRAPQPSCASRRSCATVSALL